MSSAIETLNGHFVDPLAMDVLDLRIGDIAHSLSQQCRFNGYTSRHYSVAEHSVIVSMIVERAAIAAGMDTATVKTLALQGLMHDATEAYLCDIPRPIKRHLTNYEEIEADLWQVICGKFNLPMEMHPLTLEADMRICTTEKLTLIGPDGMDNPSWAATFANYPPYQGVDNLVMVKGLQPVYWKYRFLEEFERLTA
jgi:hypothetical protein